MQTVAARASTYSAQPSQEAIRAARTPGIDPWSRANHNHSVGTGPGAPTLYLAFGATHPLARERVRLPEVPQGTIGVQRSVVRRLPDEREGRGQCLMRCRCRT